MRSLVHRYHEGGRLSDEQMALLQYQRENLHFLSEEVCAALKFTIGSVFFLFIAYPTVHSAGASLLHKEFQLLIHMLALVLLNIIYVGLPLFWRMVINMQKFDRADSAIARVLK